MPNLATHIYDLVDQLKSVVRRIDSSDALQVQVESFVISLKVTISNQVGVEGKSGFVLVNAGQSRALVQTLLFTFERQPPNERVAKQGDLTLDESLERAAQAIDIAVGEVAQDLESFGLKSGAVTLAFSASENGSINLGVVNGSVKQENVSTIEMHFTLKRDTPR
jgi:hypothetical protein